MKWKIKTTAIVIWYLTVATYASGQDMAIYDGALLTIVNDTIVASEAPGVIREINFSPGSDIEQYETMVSLNRESFEAEYNVAKTRSAIAEIEATNDVNVRFARKSLAVNQKLFERSQRARQVYTQSVSKTDLDRLDLEVQQSKLSAEQAELQSEIANKNTDLEYQRQEVARNNLENRDIRAPFTGRVEQIYVQRGQWVNAGAPIARIIDLHKLRIKGIFHEKFILGIRIGNEATFRYRIGDRSFMTAAKVTYVSAEVKNNVFQVWLDVDNSDLNLIPGFQGKLEIELKPLQSKAKPDERPTPSTTSTAPPAR